MATPMVRVLRAAFPHSRLDFFVGSWSRQAVLGNPSIDNVVDCGRVGSGSYSIAEYLKIARKLREGNYDVCFVLERSAVISVLPWLAGIPCRIGLDSEGRGFSLTRRVSCDEVKLEVELYLDTIRSLGIDPGKSRLEFFPSDSDVEAAGHLLGEMGVSGPGGTRPPNTTASGTTGKPSKQVAAPRPPVIAIHPGGGVNPGMDLLAKRWPAQRFATLADRAIAEYGAAVIVVGARSDATLAGDLEDAMLARPLNLAGKTNLGELAAVFQRCDLFLGNDTGPLHLAVAVGTSVIAVFGPTDERVYGPYSDDAVAISSQVSCRPCFVKGVARPCTSFECVMSIPVDQVWKEVEAKLDAKGFQKLGSVVECST